MKKIEKIFLILVFLLAFFLRVYRLGENPYNFQRKEVFFGYNAYSFLKTGRDINHKALPLIFQYFEREEYFLPVYTYLTIPSIAVFGLNEFAVRFPSVFFGTLTVLVTFFLTQEIFKKKVISYKLSVISCFLLALSPWHLHFSRQASPSTLSLFFIVLGVYLFLKSKKRLSVFAFCLSLLTYQNHWLFVILLNLILLIWTKWKDIHKKNIWRLWCLLSFLLCLWLLRSTAKTGEIIFDSLFFDEYFNNLTLLEKILKALENYFYYFSFEFLFFSGDTYIDHGIAEMGELYLFTLPLLLIGIYQVFQQRRVNKGLIFSWWFISFLQPAFYRFSVDAGKSLPAVVPLMIFTAIGTVRVFKWLSAIKKKLLLFTIYPVFLYGVYCLLFAVYSYDLLTYFHIYWVHYFKKTQNQGEAAFKQVVKQVEEKQDVYERFFITNDTDGATLFTLFYLDYPPKRFLEEKGTRFNFGKFSFDQLPAKETDKKVFMVTSSSKEAPAGFSKLQEVNFLNNNVAFTLWEN